MSIPSLTARASAADLLGVVVAKMSEKLDQHGATLAAVQTTALESRDPIFTLSTKPDTKKRRYVVPDGKSYVEVRPNMIGLGSDRLRIAM